MEVLLQSYLQSCNRVKPFVVGNVTMLHNGKFESIEDRRNSLHLSILSSFVLGEGCMHCMLHSIGKMEHYYRKIFEHLESDGQKFVQDLCLLS